MSKEKFIVEKFQVNEDCQLIVDDNGEITICNTSKTLYLLNGALIFMNATYNSVWLPDDLYEDKSFELISKYASVRKEYKDEMIKNNKRVQTNYINNDDNKILFYLFNWYTNDGRLLSVKENINLENMYLRRLKIKSIL
jgi:hypothetical protein